MTKPKDAKPRETRRPVAAIASVAAPDFGPPTPSSYKPLFVARNTAGELLTGARDKAQTAIYIHGIGNHAAEQVLIVRWDRALFRKDMGERSRMAYWVNRARYPEAEICECLDPACACGEASEVRTRAIVQEDKLDDDQHIDEVVAELADDPAQQQWLKDLAEIMLAEAKAEAQAPTVARRTRSIGAKGIFDSLLRGLTNLVTDVALPDVNDFFFDPEARKRMEDIFTARLRTGGAPFLVIAHSQGSMIAYDVLRQLDKSDIDVKLLITIGSPLGLGPVRSVFKKWTKKKRLPFPGCVDRWINIAAAGDPVAMDSDLTGDIEAAAGRFRNVSISRAERDDNPLFDGNPHAALGYLSSAVLRDEVHAAVGPEFARSLAQQIVTPNLVESAESRDDLFRHHALIEVTETDKGQNLSIGAGRNKIDERLVDLAKRQNVPLNHYEITHHARYVAARLNRADLEVLRSEFKDLQVHRIWQNASKRALIHRSATMVHAHAAHQSYGAYGQNIDWAVLDTGINHEHPHFQTHANVASIWDCTKPIQRGQRGTDVSEPRGGFVAEEKTKADWNELAAAMRDRNGHGTHVAGIIAGAYPTELDICGEPCRLTGMAPKTRLHSFKVLDDRGDGRDAWIITALDKIASINEAAGALRIHGVNLSLGGGFDPSVYGCGHTPLCAELRRLWRQGVLIVLAAGNEGFVVLQSLNDGPWQANLDLSIGDPANLDEAIAVGSVHKSNPHTFGVSYFSSRGPTADGRAKPDLVAPGEKILSARADFKPPPRRGGKKALHYEDLYIEESGTSMAAPHVSGVLAAFLSLRREFIGYPDRVKRYLLDNCTDLGRERYAQGCGIPNLARMLAST